MTVLYVILGILAVLVILGLLLPTSYEVKRTTNVQAPPAKVHELVGELKRWPEWMPWEEQDPTIVTTLGEKSTGVGASQSWTGKGGGGEVTFTACDATKGIAYDMAFIMGEKRIPAEAKIVYVAQGDATEVQWGFTSQLRPMMPPVLAGYMGLIFPRMVGNMFDKGLAKLKTNLEA